MLTFIKVYKVENNRKIGLYKCDCGCLTTTRMSSVKNGNTRSCGCLRTENMRKINNKEIV